MATQKTNSTIDPMQDKLDSEAVDTVIETPDTDEFETVKIPRNPLLTKIGQDDYENITEPILIKLSAFFRGINTTPTQTGKVLKAWQEWESNARKREIEAEKQALLARLEELKALE